MKETTPEATKTFLEGDSPIALMNEVDFGSCSPYPPPFSYRDSGEPGVKRREVRFAPLPNFAGCRLLIEPIRCSSAAPSSISSPASSCPFWKNLPPQNSI
jgi:hypothetical protein